MIYVSGRSGSIVKKSCFKGKNPENCLLKRGTKYVKDVFRINDYTILMLLNFHTLLDQSAYTIQKKI